MLGSLGSGTLGSCRLGSGPLSPSCRSFHHMVPETIAIQSAASHSRRFELSTWDLDCTAMSKEQLVRAPTACACPLKPTLPLSIIAIWTSAQSYSSM